MTDDMTSRAAQLGNAARRPRDWYRIENAAGEDGDVAEVVIYDVISSWWGVSSSQILRELKAITTPKIVVRLNSPGGEIHEGWGIYNALRTHRATVEVRVDALAASSASVIAMAGDKIIMAKPSTLMIHDAWGGTVGPAEDHRKNADVLDQLSDQIAGVYADRAGGSVREWRDRMLEETWYTEAEAVAAGLADEIAGPPSAVAENRFDLSLFRHPPAALRREPDGRSGPPTKREVEQSLRDAGMSAQDAKAMIARGWPEDAAARDAAVERLYASLVNLR